VKKTREQKRKERMISKTCLIRWRRKELVTTRPGGTRRELMP
jgi:hypothetical protein